VLTELENLIQTMNECDREKMTKELHVWPDFHGNRSPLADPNVKGIISGLTLATDVISLAALYLATIQALAVRKTIPFD